MTPEERLDKVEGDLVRMREDHEKSIAGLRRLAFQFFKMRQADHQAVMAEYRANMAQHHVHMAENRARMAEIIAERETRKAEHLARMAEIKAAEGRIDGVEEITKLLRELLEANLRRSEKRPEAES